MRKCFSVTLKFTLFQMLSIPPSWSKEERGRAATLLALLAFVDSFFLSPNVKNGNKKLKNSNIFIFVVGQTILTIWSLLIAAVLLANNRAALNRRSRRGVVLFMGFDLVKFEQFCIHSHSLPLPSPYGLST